MVSIDPGRWYRKGLNQTLSLEKIKLSLQINSPVRVIWNKSYANKQRIKKFKRITYRIYQKSRGRLITSHVM